MRRLVLALLCAPRLAAAEPEPPRNALSFFPLTLGSSLGVQYERQIASRVSLATSVGWRRSGGDDFSVTEVGSGLEGRLWLGRCARPGCPMTRWYAGARLDLGLTGVQVGERVVGSTLRTAASISLGRRFVIADTVEITPSLGIGARTEIDPRGRLAAWTRPELLRLGLTAGVMF